MKCENCGRQIKDDENYCPNCGMEIVTSDKPLQKKYLNNDYIEEDYDRKDTYQEPEIYEYENKHTTKKERKKSGGWLPILLFLLLLMMIGFVVGLIMYTTNLQSTP